MDYIITQGPFDSHSAHMRSSSLRLPVRMLENFKLQMIQFEKNSLKCLGMDGERGSRIICCAANSECAVRVRVSYGSR